MGHNFSQYLFDVSMQRLSTTNAVTPKGKMINGCAVDYWIVYIHIIGAVISLVRLTFGGGETWAKFGSLCPHSGSDVRLNNTEISV
jgi:hypothetical protein